MKINRMNRIFLLGLVIVIAVMLVTSTMPGVATKPDRELTGKQLEKQGDKLYKDAMKKIKHDLKKLKEGIDNHDETLKREAFKSFEDAKVYVTWAGGKYKAAGGKYTDEYEDDPSKLKRADARLDVKVGKCIEQDRRLGYTIGLTYKIIHFERLMDDVSDECDEIIDDIIDELYDAILDVLDGEYKNAIGHIDKIIELLNELKDECDEEHHRDIEDRIEGLKRVKGHMQDN